jgi:hypothetical protein
MGEGRDSAKRRLGANMEWRNLSSPERENKSTIDLGCPKEISREFVFSLVLFGDSSEEL